MEQNASHILSQTHNNATDEHVDMVELLTFSIDNEEFAMHIKNIQEIKAWIPTTRLPNAPLFVLGVINLRGVIIPIYDLRARFAMGETTPTSKHVYIIFSANEQIIGMLVDTVNDIQHVPADEIKPSPSVSINIDDEYIDGLVTIGERMVVTLNTERMFDASHLEIQNTNITKSLEKVNNETKS